MRWNIIICLLISSTVIAAHFNKEHIKEKRSLSFIKSLFSKDSDLEVERTSVRCPHKLHHKTRKRNQILSSRRRRVEEDSEEENEDDGPDSPENNQNRRGGNRIQRRRRKQLKPKPKRGGNNGNNSRNNGNNYRNNQPTNRPSTTTTKKPRTRTTTENTTICCRDDMPYGTNGQPTHKKPKLQNISGNILIHKYEPNIVMSADDSLRMEHPLYVTPTKYRMTGLQYGHPLDPYGSHLIGMPSKYSYEKLKDDVYDSMDNSDFMDAESSVLVPKYIPPYEDDRKDLRAFPSVNEISSKAANQQFDDRIAHIFSDVTQHTNQFSTIPNQQYESVNYPNTAFDQQFGALGGLKMVPDKYTGQPIIVMDESEIIKKALGMDGQENNGMVKQNVYEMPRGDI